MFDFCVNVKLHWTRVIMYTVKVTCEKWLVFVIIAKLTSKSSAVMYFRTFIG